MRRPVPAIGIKRASPAPLTKRKSETSLGFSILNTYSFEFLNNSPFLFLPFFQEGPGG
jgi:hypothetical protein